jgi:predicted ATP-grasp superfamily ATP-dependent carboligase
MRGNVLLTYGWVRSSYAALRNLYAHGVSVHVGDTGRIGMSQFSRFKQGVSLYRSHYKDEDAFVSDVKRLCEEQDIDLILPSHNETEVLAKHRDQLDERLTRLLPRYEHCLLFNNKSTSYDYVKTLGVPVPPRYAYDKPEDLLTQLEGQGTVVIKMLTGNSAKGVFYAHTPGAAIDIVNGLIKRYNLSPDRYPQIEQKVEGEGWGCSVLYWQGKPIADFSHRRLREKIATGGTSTLRELADHPGIREAAKLIFTKLGWHGLAMCEFKVCPKTGQFWFIEVNPRMWGSIPLAINAGVEFPYLAWLCATQGPEKAQIYHKNHSLQTQHKARWLLGDLMLAAKLLLCMQWPTAWKILMEKVDSTDDFYWDDPLAFVGEVIYYLKNSLAKLSLNPEEKGMLK